jgi:transcription elongation factor Elf1
MNSYCPGSMRIKEPMPEFFTCPDCGEEVEIWTHERTRKCSSCGKSVFREINSAWCVQWCQYAKECIGAEQYEELLKSGAISQKAEEAIIPGKLKEFMKERGMSIPGEGKQSADL